MKRLLLASTILLCISSSCDNSRARNNKKQDVPKALEDKSDTYRLDYRRGMDDLVEGLYKELVAKDPELKELENKIGSLNDSRNDSTETFQTFNSKNKLYYNGANRHVEQMTDSLLKLKLKNMITASMNKYQSLVSQHNAILDSIEVKNATLNDLHTILKITRTLPLIETYQSDNLPSTKPLKGYARQWDDAMRLADTLTKK
jgi:hypothetical protein